MSHQREVGSRLVLFNANVLTLNRRLPRAEAVAIQGDRITWVGKDSDRNEFCNPGAILIDCHGKTLIPGFNDAHCHILSYAASLASLDVSPSAVSSIQDIKSAIRKRAQDLSPGSWIRGTGYNEFYLKEKRHPNRWDLDEAAPNHPVKLVHRSGHANVLNSLALRLAGISLVTPEPEGGMIDRDIHTGEPTGILYDMEDYPPLKEIARLSPDQIRDALALASQKYLSLGITSLQDATPYDVLGQWEVLTRLKEEGRFLPRVWKMVSPEALEELKERGLHFQSGTSSLKIGAVKIVLRETAGTLYPTETDLRGLVLGAHEAGFPVALHTVEETTVEAAIEALEYARLRAPSGVFRDRIEHCSVCPPWLLERMKKLGVLVVTQPAFVYYSGERYLSEVSPQQLPWLYRIRSFWKAGLKPAAGSDSPVVPPDPLVGVYAAATRSTSAGVPLLAQERVTPLQALRMYTTAAAYSSGEERVKGSIAPGKLADLVLLSRDPTRVPLGELLNITVEMTFLGGTRSGKSHRGVLP